MNTELILTNGELIRLARQKAGLNQSQLGERIGVRQETISSWENEHTEPTARQLKAIEDTTGFALWVHLRPYENPLERGIDQAFRAA
jgi:transcriptional regulator with XRE-family HTH domain